MAFEVGGGGDTDAMSVSRLSDGVVATFRLAGNRATTLPEMLQEGFRDVEIKAGGGDHGLNLWRTG